MIFDILEIIIKALELIILSIITTLGLINLNRKLKLKILEQQKNNNDKRQTIKGKTKAKIEKEYETKKR